jgi:hypothetical protein
VLLVEVRTGPAGLRLKLELEHDELIPRDLHLGATTWPFEHFAHLDHAADVQRAVFDRADLEHVTAAGDDVADLPRRLLAREVAKRLAGVADELVPKDTCHRPFHDEHPTAVFG